MAVYPESVEAAPGATFAIAIMVQPGGTPVDAAECHLNFDPAFLEVVSLTQGSALPQVLIPATFDNISGTIDFAAGSFVVRPETEFTLFDVEFRALGAAAGTMLDFNFTHPRLTDVTSLGYSVLNSTTAGVVIVNEVGPVTVQVDSISIAVSGGASSIDVTIENGPPSATLIETSADLSDWFPVLDATSIDLGGGKFRISFVAVNGPKRYYRVGAAK